MKINKTKLAVTTLAIAMGAALAGSISGSVAWYQYSTRAAANLTGTAAGTTRELQVKEGSGDWKQYLQLGEADYSPVTPKTVASEKVSAFSGHPVYQYSALPDALGTEYLSKTLSFQVLEANKSQTTPAALTTAKDLYLTKLEISGDVADLVRVAVYAEGASSGMIFAKSGTSTVTQGALDLNGNGYNDTDAIDQKDGQGEGAIAGEAVTYGNVASYAHHQISDVVEFTDAYTPGSALKIGATDKTLTVQVWLEGWAKLSDGKNCWDLTKTLAKQFSVNLRFEVVAEK